MLKKTITYVDFNGDEVSEEFLFHLSKAELVELEVSHKGGLQEAIRRIVEAEDGKAIIAEFKNIILSSYGKRSDDGRRFIKNQTLRDEFESTEAYSTLFIELVTDADKAAEFVRGVIPQDLAEEAAKAVPSNSESEKEESEKEESEKEESEKEVRKITAAELREMSTEEMLRTQERAQAGEVEIVE